MVDQRWERHFKGFFFFFRMGHLGVEGRDGRWAGGWCRSLVDARVSAQAWERFAYRIQREGFSFGRLTYLLLSTRTTLFIHAGWVTTLGDQRSDLPEVPWLFNPLQWKQVQKLLGGKRIGTLEEQMRQWRCFSFTPELFSDMNLLAACWCVAGAPALPRKHFSMGVATGARKKERALC